jgi:hypothetical protein
VKIDNHGIFSSLSENRPAWRALFGKETGRGDFPV